MPAKRKLTYSTLPLLVRGYADSIIAHGGCSSFEQEWDDIDAGDFSGEALAAMLADCSSFHTAAIALHPKGKAGLGRDIGGHDLGWHFFLARQGTGVSYENFMLGEFGDRLTELACRFDWVEVEISEVGEICFLT